MSDNWQDGTRWRGKGEPRLTDQTRIPVSGDVLPGRDFVVISPGGPGTPPVALSMSSKELSAMKRWLTEQIIWIRYAEDVAPSAFTLGEPIPLPDGWWQVDLTPVEDT